jgi:hypothetical protein
MRGLKDDMAIADCFKIGDLRLRGVGGVGGVSGWNRVRGCEHEVHLVNGGASATSRLRKPDGVWCFVAASQPASGAVPPLDWPSSLGGAHYLSLRCSKSHSSHSTTAKTSMDHRTLCTVHERSSFVANKTGLTLNSKATRY